VSAHAQVIRDALEHGKRLSSLREKCSKALAALDALEQKAERAEQLAAALKRIQEHAESLPGVLFAREVAETATEALAGRVTPAETSGT
jgi:hypothetical protein